MERKKIHLEYLLNATSKSILWAAISTPTGLEGWFADRVQSDDKTVTFFWGKTEKRDAEIIAVRAYSFIRFRWLDDENEREYFELKMTNNELTNDFVLEITDFADIDEAKPDSHVNQRAVEENGVAGIMGIASGYFAKNLWFLVNFRLKISRTPFFVLLLCSHCMKRVKCCA